MTIAVITSIYGSYDTPLRPEAQDVPCEFILVTDREPESECGWRVVVEPRPHVPPRLASKVARSRLDLYSDADILIWADGNLAIRSGLAGWAASSLGDADLAAFDSIHLRGGIRNEAIAASQMQKYEGQDVTGQADHYVAAGMPDDWGLWWTGLLVRRRSCPDFGDAWLTEMIRWSNECQVSFPYVLWRAGLRPASLPDEGTRHFIRCIHPGRKSDSDEKIDVDA